MLMVAMAQVFQTPTHASFGVSLSFFLTYRINEILHESCLARLPSTSSGSLQTFTDTACTLKHERHVGTKNKQYTATSQMLRNLKFLHLQLNMQTFKIQKLNVTGPLN